MEQWKTNLYTLWGTQLISILSFSLGIPFMAFYLREFGVTNDAEIKYYLGILAAGPAFSMAIVSPIWGLLGDKYGKKMMLMRAMIAASLILIGLGCATELKQLIMLRIAQGLFTGTMTAANALVASGTPQHKMSFSLGFLSSANFLGMALGPAIGGFVGELIGYRISFIAGGISMFIGFLLVLFLVKEKKVVRINIEKSDGLLVNRIKEVLSPVILSALFIILCLNTVRTMFNPFLALFIKEMLGTLEGAPRITGLVSTAKALMLAVAGLTISRLGDKYEKYKILKALIITGFVISLVVGLPHNLVSFAIVYPLMFLALGGIEPIVLAICVEDIPSEKRGLLFGFIGVVVNLGLGISPLIGGWISINYSLRSILFIIPILILLAFISVLYLIKKIPVKIERLNNNRISQ